MTDKSEEARSQPATGAGPIEPENKDRSVNGVNPRRDRKKTNKVDRKNGSIATRFKKGCKSPNPKGRPKKVVPDPDSSPGDIIQAMDNEMTVVVVDGKRRSVTKAEARFLQLFDQADKEDLKAAKLIASMFVDYFAFEPKGEASPETHWLVLPDEYYDNPDAYKNIDLKKIGRWDGPPPPPITGPLATSYLFRKVASEEVVMDVYGTRMKMPRWHAYVRRIYMMAQQNTGAAKLLDQLRKKFPGKPLPGPPIIRLITEEDTGL